MKPPSKSTKKSINEYISKLKKQNSLLTKALNEEKKITRRLLGSKLATEQKLDALQKAYNMQLGAINDITNFFKGTVNIFQQKAEYLDEIRMEANAIIDECNVTCHTTSINNHFLKRKAPSTPTRQVVQPMVGGFTIQRPIVNLARLSFSNNRNHNQVLRNNVINNVQNVVVSENEAAEIDQNSTNSSREREDHEWITASPVVRLHPLIIGDNRINDSIHGNYTEDEESEFNNEDNNTEEDTNSVNNQNSSTNNLQDITNIIQSTADNNVSADEISDTSPSALTTVDRSVNMEHSEHNNGDI